MPALFQGHGLAGRLGHVTALKLSNWIQRDRLSSSGHLSSREREREREERERDERERERKRVQTQIRNITVNNTKLQKVLTQSDIITHCKKLQGMERSKTVKMLQ